MNWRRHQWTRTNVGKPSNYVIRLGKLPGQSDLLFFLLVLVSQNVRVLRELL
jgi:hypothetical protein